MRAAQKSTKKQQQPCEMPKAAVGREWEAEKATVVNGEEVQRNVAKTTGPREADVPHRSSCTATGSGIGVTLDPTIAVAVRQA